LRKEAQKERKKGKIAAKKLPELSDWRPLFGWACTFETSGGKEGKKKNKPESRRSDRFITVFRIFRSPYDHLV